MPCGANTTIKYKNNTVIAPGGDAAVLRIQGTRRALAVSTDGNGRLVYLEPQVGAAIAVAEACRNLSCVGAEPVALTDGLNFGNPETADVQYQLQGAISGIAEAANAFDIPVISGNASLYNESAASAVQPTPIIGAVGVLDNVELHARSAFREEGDAVILLGADSPWDDAAGIAGSEALAEFYGFNAGLPAIDLDLEIRVQKLCRFLIRHGTVNSAHDVSHGGIAVAITESAIQGNIGVSVEHPNQIVGKNWLAALFGESQSRIVVTAEGAKVEKILRAASNASIPAARIGTVGGDRIRFNGEVDLSLSTATDVWLHAFEKAASGGAD